MVRHNFQLGLGIFGVAALMVLTGCENNPSAGAGQGQAPMAAPVTVVAAVKKTVQPLGEWTGRFASPESVEIRARVAGVIEQVHFKAGQRVQKGEVLFSIDPEPFKAELARAEAQLLSAKTQAALSKSEAARSKKLLEAKATSQQEFDQLHASQLSAEAAVKAAEAAVQTAKLNLGYTEIHAPISGRVSRAMVTEGNLISAGTPVLTTIESVDKMYVYFSMSEQAYLQSVEALKNNHGVSVSMGLADELGTPHEGKLDFVDNHVNPTTGSIQARAVFTNSDGQWVPGLFARVKVPEGLPRSAILVPDKAVGTDQSNKVLWVVTPDDKAVPRTVTLGELEDGLRVVTSGLKEGEHVIVDGTQRVQPGMPVKPELEKAEGNHSPAPSAK